MAKVRHITDLKELGAAFADAARAGSTSSPHDVSVSGREKMTGNKETGNRLRKGQHVVLVDADIQGTVVSAGKKVLVETADGLRFETEYSEVAVADEHEESMMRCSVPKAGRREKMASPAPGRTFHSGTVTLDLHIEAIPGGRSVPPESRLAFQLQYFRRAIRENMKHCGMKMNVIHGIGDGILRDAVRRELEDVFAIHCTYSPGPPGVTVVTFR